MIAVILVEALEFFELFLGKDLVEILYAINSVVEQCFLSLENACLSCGNLLFVIAVECFVQSLFGVHLLLAEFLECGICLQAERFECGLLFVRDLENGIHEFWAGAFLEVELLVEMLAFFEVFARTFRAAIAEVLAVEAFAMEFAVVLAMMHSAALAAVAGAVVLVAVAATWIHPDTHPDARHLIVVFQQFQALTLLTVAVVELHAP